MTRSKRNQPGAAASRSAHVPTHDTNSQQLPSPPKTRARGKQSQQANKPVLATGKRGAKGVLAMAEAAAESSVLEQQDHYTQLAGSKAVSPLLQQSLSSHVQRVQSSSSTPEAVLATVPDSSPNEESKQQHPTAAAEAAVAWPPEEEGGQASPAHVASPSTTTAAAIPQPSHRSFNSTSRPGKRQRSMAVEDEVASQSTHHQSASPELQQKDMSAANRISSEAQQVVAESKQEDGVNCSLMLQQQPADQMDVSSPEAHYQQQAMPEDMEQASLSPHMPAEATEPAAPGVPDSVSPAKQQARSSDYQDAHERLSSPLSAAPSDPGEGQQPAEGASPMLVNDPEETQMPPASPVDSSGVPQQDIEAAAHDSPVAAASLQASPAHEDIAYAAADATAAAGTLADEHADDQLEGTETDSELVRPSTLGVATAVPLPGTAANE